MLRAVRTQILTQAKEEEMQREGEQNRHSTNTRETGRATRRPTGSGTRDWYVMTTEMRRTKCESPVDESERMMALQDFDAIAYEKMHE